VAYFWVFAVFFSSCMHVAFVELWYTYDDDDENLGNGIQVCPSTVCSNA